MSQSSKNARALLILPRLRIQNANAISGPLTWGFPSITAFTGLMTALERSLGPRAGIALMGVGVICHRFEAQTSHDGYTHSFHLTRNPILPNGTTASIVEEGRVNLDITLVFSVELAASRTGEAERAELAERIGELLAGMRVAGGSIVPALAGILRRPARAKLVLLAEDQAARAQQFERLSRRWLPGFALVSRDDLLHERHQALQAEQPGASLLDAWLDLSRLNYRATEASQVDLDPEDEDEPAAQWSADARAGWTVPMPVGFAPLSELHPPGAVANARDPGVPFRFVECVYSIGQWISPHRLGDIDQLVWRPSYDPQTGLYRCINDFKPEPAPQRATLPVSSSY